MRSHRKVSAILLLVIMSNIFFSTVPAKAQENVLFEGMIAYVDEDHNIVLMRGDGTKKRITTDGSASENGVQYSCPRFSSNGKYLTYKGDWTTVYDLTTETKTVLENINIGLAAMEYGGEFDCGPLWYKDTDSFIVSEYKDGYETLRQYYLQSVSGERTLLYEIVKEDNGFSINFNLDTIIYSNKEWKAVVENWNKNIEYVVSFVPANGVIGFWTPDGKKYVFIDDGEEYWMFDLETGTRLQSFIITDFFPYEDLNGNRVIPPYKPTDISPDSNNLLFSYEGQLYSISLSSLDKKALYSSQYKNVTSSFDDISLYGVWSLRGNLLMAYEDNPQKIIDRNYSNITVVEMGQNPVPVNTDVYPFFWMGNTRDQFLYAKNNFIGNEVQLDLMLYDHNTRENISLAKLPSYKSGDSLSYWISDQVDWTSGETKFQGDIEEPTPTPEPPLSLPSNEYDDIFDTKKEIIEYLENPPINIFEYNNLIPWSFMGTVTGYDESYPRFVLENLETEYEAYRNGQLNSAEMQIFENRMSAFKRLTYTEMGLQGLFPSMSQLTYDMSKAFIETTAIGLELIFSIRKLADAVEKIVPIFSSPIQKLKNKITFWILDSFETSLDKVFDISNPREKEWRDILQLFITEIKGRVNGPKTLIEVIKDLGVKRLLSERLIVAMLEDSMAIDTAARSVYPENTTNPTLSVVGSDEDAYDAVQRVITAETKRAEESHQRTESVTSIAELAQNASELSSIIEDTINLDPGQFAEGLAEKISKITTTFDFFSQWMNAYATFDSGYNMVVLGDRMLKIHEIAFDPSEINNLKNFHGYQPAQYVDIYPQPMGENILPAHIYYSTYEQRFFTSVDDYQQRVQEVLSTLQYGSDEELLAAIDNLVLADDEVSHTISVAKKPLLQEYYTNDQARTFVDSSQEFSSSNISFQLVLLLSLADRANPEIQQQVLSAGQQLIRNSNGVKNEYATLTQAGLDLSITPSALIADYELPETVNVGEQFLLKLTLSNPSLNNFSGNVVIREGELISGTQISVGEIPSGKESVYEIPIQTVSGGSDIIIVELIQGDTLIDTNLVFIQVEGQQEFSPESVSSEPVSSEQLNIPSSLILGGLGFFLCLIVLAIGGVFGFRYYQNSKPAKKSQPRRAPSKPQAKPISQSERQIQQAISLAKANQLEEAFNLLREVVRSEPNNSSAWFNLGTVLARMKRVKDAERCYQRAKQLGHPKADAALDWLRKTYQ